MTLLQFELYNEYHRCNDIEARYEIGRQIVKVNKQNPIPWYWLNDYESTLPGEEWKPIGVPFFCKYVHISDHGRIKRLQRNVNGHRSGNPKNWPERILIPSQKDAGRLRFSVYVDHRKLTTTPHRAVGVTFLPNPHKKPCINHIDGDPKNCHYLNLEWVTYSENELHSFRVLGKEVNVQKGVLSPFYKGKIKCLTTNGTLVKEYECASDVKKDGFHLPHVYRVANGIRKTTGGLVWEWV